MGNWQIKRQNGDDFKDLPLPTKVHSEGRAGGDVSGWVFRWASGGDGLA